MNEVNKKLYSIHQGVDKFYMDEGMLGVFSLDELVIKLQSLFRHHIEHHKKVGRYDSKELYVLGIELKRSDNIPYYQEGVRYFIKGDNPSKIQIKRVDGTLIKEINLKDNELTNYS